MIHFDRNENRSNKIIDSFFIEIDKKESFTSFRRTRVIIPARSFLIRYIYGAEAVHITLRMTQVRSTRVIPFKTDKN